MREQKTVDSEGVKKLLTLVREALPAGLKKMAEITYNKRLADMGCCPHSINATFKKKGHHGFSVEGWRADRFSRSDTFRGLTLMLKEARFAYDGREKCNYPIRKDGTVSIDKIVKAIASHQEHLKIAEKRADAEAKLQDTLHERIEKFGGLFDETDLTAKVCGTASYLRLQVGSKGNPGRVDISISRDLEARLPFQIQGTFLCYTAAGIVEVVTTMFRLAEKLKIEL